LVLSACCAAAAFFKAFAATNVVDAARSHGSGVAGSCWRGTLLDLRGVLASSALTSSRSALTSSRECEVLVLEDDLFARKNLRSCTARVGGGAAT